MQYIAIFGYDKATDCAQACVLGDKPSMTQMAYWKKPISKIIEQVIRNNMKPLNFGIDRQRNLVEDNGAFTRFTKEGVLVIIAEFVDTKGNILGYRVISSTNGAIYNMTLDNLREVYLQRKAAVMSPNFVFIQNAIVRQYNTGITISCYPLKPFEQILIKSKKEIKTVKKPVVEETPVTTKVTEKVNTKVNEPVHYTEAQEREKALCREKGIDDSLISNPELSEEQMRVLWFSKATKGSFAEYFNNPKISVASMKMYADLLCSQELVDKYKDLLEHPELDPQQIQELMNCIDSGVDYKDLIGLPAEDIYYNCVSRNPKYWSLVDFDKTIPSESWRDSELLDCMMREAYRLKSREA